MNISTWLDHATKTLQSANISSARLDAEIILAHTIRHSRTYLHAHNDELLNDRHHEIADARIRLRAEFVPIAYIIGHKEFYGRQFHVTSATLIPRPETEQMINALNELLPDSVALLGHGTMRLVDVGTGSGCIGITAKLEHPELDVTLIDISNHALTIAEKNANALHAEVTLLKSNLLGSYPFIAHYIVANLPYVDEDWKRSPETEYEPRTALFAGDGGLSLIKQLLTQTTTSLAVGGTIVFEADPRQHAVIKSTAAAYNLKEVHRSGFVIAFKKTS